MPALASAAWRRACSAFRARGALFGELRRRGVPATSIRMRGRVDTAGWRRALACAATQPDVVVSRNVSGQLVGAAIARRGKGRPRAERAHAGQGGRRARAPRVRTSGAHPPVATRRVDAVIAVTESQVEPLEPLGYRRAVDGGPNGVFDAAADVHPPRVRGRHLRGAGACPDDPRSAIDVFIEAVQAARAQNPGISGYVAGEGREDGAARRAGRAAAASSCWACAPTRSS